MQRVPRTLMTRSGCGALFVAMLVAAATLCASAPDALAASASFWKTDSFVAAEEGRLDGVSILRDGRIVLSHELERLDVPEAQYVWAGEGMGDSVVVAVVGTPGEVLRLGDGDPVRLLSLETADLPAMAVSPAGDIFVGTAPGGEVHVITPDGESRLFFETGEGYIWSMAFSPDHGLLVGTGDDAKVYAVDNDGTGVVIYESDDASVSALAVQGGRVLAGTSIDGLLLDITPGGDLRVLCDTWYEEISGIVRDADGTLYFAATSVSLEDALDGSGDYGSGFGEGAVFRMTPGGGAVELWRSHDAPVTSLGFSPDGSILAGTGSGGRIYAVGYDGAADLVAELGGEEVLSIRGAGDIIVTVGAPGAVYRMGPDIARSGQYESEPFDARATSTWGALAWKTDVSAGAGVELFTRSGNTGDPDGTWSEWAPAAGDGGGQIVSPPARFLQWKAVLSRGSRGAGPELLSVEAAYLRENLPPLVSSVTVFEPGDVVTGTAGGTNGSSATHTLPGGVEVTYSLDPSAPADRELPVLLRGMRTASWEALDPNGDALLFDLFLKADDEDDWKLVEEGVLRRTLHTWDTLSMTDGVYRLKVRASDRSANPKESALTASAESQPFTVDHTPPEFTRVDVTSSAGGLTVSGAVTDSASPVMFVDVSIDYGAWKPAFADDGMFDSRGESFTLVIEGLESGEHTVSIRAADRSGNPVVARKLAR